MCFCCSTMRDVACFYLALISLRIRQFASFTISRLTDFVSPLSFAHPLSQAPILLCCSTFVAPSSVWCVLFAFRFGFSSLPHSTFSNLFSIASNRLLALLSVLVLCLSPSLNYCCDHSFASLVTMWFAASLFAVYRIDIYGSIFLSLLPLERPLRAWDNSMQSHQIS